MPRATDLLGLAGSALVLLWAAVVAGRRAGLRRGGLWGLGVAAGFAAVVPIGGLPAAGYLRGVIGELSLASLLLLTDGIVRGLRGLGPRPTRDTVSFQVLVGAAGLLLYPLALGVGYLDPYRLGFGDPWMLGVLLSIVLLAWLLDVASVAGWVSLAVLAWGLGAYESRNLWDYLIDPLVTAWALAALSLRGVQALRRGLGTRLRSRFGSSR